jgi:ribosome-associated protein
MESLLAIEERRCRLPIRSESMTAEETARLCAQYAYDKKAEDIIILDVRDLSPIVDFFVICTASSPPHLRAIQNEIDECMDKEHGQMPRWRERNFESQWLVIDYTDVMVHVFQPEKREFYALEELWSDGQRLNWTPTIPASHAG